MTQNAAVKSTLSTRARTLSQRRKNRTAGSGEGVDLSGQDTSLKDRESGLWVPAGQHRDYADEEDEEEEEEEAETAPAAEEKQGVVTA